MTLPKMEDMTKEHSVTWYTLGRMLAEELSPQEAENLQYNLRYLRHGIIDRLYARTMQSKTLKEKPGPFPDVKRNKT